MPDPRRHRLRRWTPAACGAVAAIALLLGGWVAGKAEAAHQPSCQALHAAAFLDEPVEMQGLLQHGADVNCLDQLGQTPLVTAVNGASFHCFNLLMDAGARVDVRTEYGQPLLTHTLDKVKSLNMDGAQSLQNLYRQMASRLMAAGAHE